MVPLKSEEELRMLRISGHILARVMRKIAGAIKEGVSTQEIDELAFKLISGEGALAAFKGYRDFPAHICASLNEEIVHGIPSKRRLKQGDILSLDLGINYSGYFTDAAFTVAVGRVNQRAAKLIRTAKEALREGIKKARPGNNLFDISYAIQNYVEKNGFSVVREFVGHGIGRNLHEEPEIPNFGRPHGGLFLREGMVLAIEPMVNMGCWQSKITENGWTAVTEDGLPSAHFEHTVVVTQNGPEILTA